jgi:tetraacyldisaccharide 4'-kinase
VLVGSNRAEAIGMGMKQFPIDVVILDDGFQLRNIEKDMEVLVIKGGGGREGHDLFPLGPCREPLERVRDADIILVNKGHPGKDVEAYMDETPCYTMGYRPAHLYNLKLKGMVHYRFLKGKKVLAFSGLGDNRSFFDLLRELGAHVVHEISFEDHHAYTEKEIERIVSYPGAEMIVTTEKDGVKIAAMDVPNHFFYLAVTVEINREKELFELIQEKLKREIWQRESLYSTRH